MSVSQWVCHTKRAKCSTDRNPPLSFTILATKVVREVWLLIVLVEIRKMRVRQTGSGIIYHYCSFGKIALVSNISKTVTDTRIWSMEVEYETDPWLSIGTMTFDLGWPWTVLVQGRYNYRSNISKMVTDTMMGSIEVAVHGNLLFGYWGWKQHAWCIGQIHVPQNVFLVDIHCVREKSNPLNNVR